ncbi:MAG TPA: polysaccharide deacetylase family protein [Marmoricola sp.]|nr:polysaccharide deacetylase family protein [Marmoricola sp.]
MKPRGVFRGGIALATLGSMVACGATVSVGEAPPGHSAVVLAKHPRKREVKPDHTAAPQAIKVPGCPFPARTPITSAPGQGRTVALTFDDGSSAYTPQILAVLKRFHVHATFFDTGLHDRAFPKDAKAVTAAGDEIGNHTYHHLRNWGYLKYFPRAVQRAEVADANAVLKPLIGHAPCVMRPPGGAYDAGSLEIVRSMGMSLVLWTTDAQDWRQPPYLSASYQQTILKNAEQGIRWTHPIVLMHAGKASSEPNCGAKKCVSGQVSDFRGNTVAVLARIITFYRDNGYRFVTLS